LSALLWHYRGPGSNSPQKSWKLWLNASGARNLAEEMNQMDAPKTSAVQYAAKVHTTGGRDGGASRASDGRLDIKLSVPGTPGTGTNPEQLLAAGWSACFLTNVKIAGGKMKVRVPPEAAIDAEVDLCSGDGGFFLQARLNVSLPGVDRETARTLVDAAHQMCPYSKATRGNVSVEINLV
jgi:osmotically inducible protein OsmC